MYDNQTLGQVLRGADSAVGQQPTLRSDIQAIGQTIEGCLSRARDLRARLFGHSPEPQGALATAPREDCLAAEVIALSNAAQELQSVLSQFERIG